MAPAFSQMDWSQYFRSTMAPTFPMRNGTNFFPMNIGKVRLLPLEKVEVNASTGKVVNIECING